MEVGSSKADNLNGKGLNISIIFSRFNDAIGNELLQNAVDALNAYDATTKIIRVPGSLEIPLTAKHVAEQQQPHAIIALGIIIKGETNHFDFVCNESHRGIMNVMLQTGIPIIFGIIPALTPEQARQRVSKGKQYAEAAIEMAQTINNLKS